MMVPSCLEFLGAGACGLVHAGFKHEPVQFPCRDGHVPRVTRIKTGHYVCVKTGRYAKHCAAEATVTDGHGSHTVTLKYSKERNCGPVYLPRIIECTCTACGATGAAPCEHASMLAGVLQTNRTTLDDVECAGAVQAGS